jgi:hypothetical protein
VGFVQFWAAPASEFHETAAYEGFRDNGVEVPPKLSRFRRFRRLSYPAPSRFASAWED